MPTLAVPVRSIAKRNALVEQWAGLPSHVAQRVLRGRSGALPGHIGFADLVGIGQLALIRAAELWMPGRGSSFATYAFKSILFRLLRALEPAAREMNRTTRFLEGDDFPERQPDDDQHEELRLVLSRLSRQERRYLQARVVRGGLGVLAAKMGVSHQGVSERSRAALARARELAAELR